MDKKVYNNFQFYWSMVINLKIMINLLWLSNIFTEAINKTLARFYQCNLKHVKRNVSFFTLKCIKPVFYQKMPYMKCIEQNTFKKSQFEFFFYQEMQKISCYRIPRPSWSKVNKEMFGFSCTSIFNIWPSIVMKFSLNSEIH